jgi:hypothetical protein
MLEKAANHAFSNAWLNGMTGGDIEHGFITGALSSLGNNVIHDNIYGETPRVACAAALGGTIEEIGGGKFANGAITGAYGMLFNDLVHGQGIPPRKKGGNDFLLARMYMHFQIGGGDPMTIIASSLDFSETSQTQLGLNGMKPGDERSVNLFNSGVNSISLAFGKVSMVYQGNDQFSISRDRFDFNIEWQNGFSARNVGTVIGGAINCNLMLNRVATLVPLIFGGLYDVYFKGTATIPK